MYGMTQNRRRLNGIKNVLKSGINLHTACMKRLMKSFDAVLDGFT